MLAAGDTALPAEGIGPIPAQLAEALPAGSIRINAPVVKVEEGKVVLASGDEITTRAVVSGRRAADAIIRELQP
jgi:hypothetical protein